MVGARGCERFLFVGEMAATGPERALTKRQERFIRFMAMPPEECGNATEAARRAGYAAKYADRQAAQLLGNDRVLREIEAAREAQKQWADMSDQELIGRIAGIVSSETGANQLRAMELLSKIKGLQRDVQKVEHSYADEMEQLNREIQAERAEPGKLRAV